MNKIRQNKNLQFLWGLLALGLFNISVDAPDESHFFNLYDNFGFNDQESIVEIIVEQIMGYEDAIAEYADNDLDDQTQKKSNTSWDFFLNDKKIDDNHKAFRNYIKHYCLYSEGLTDGFTSIDSPPPKA